MIKYEGWTAEEIEKAISSGDCVPFTVIEAYRDNAFDQ